MSISSNLTKLTTDITNAYTSIENKGGTTPANKNTNNLPTAIDSIEVIEQATAEGESLNLVNTKAMPYNDYVVKGKSEQETRSGKNLLNNTATSQTISGVTFTVNEDGSVTCNGTATNNIFFSLTENNSIESIILNGCPAGGSGNSYLIRAIDTNGRVLKTDFGEGTEVFNLINARIQIRIAKDYICNNLTFYPMIRLATIEDDTYEPFGASPSPEYPSEIHSVADDVNLWNGDATNLNNVTYSNGVVTQIQADTATNIIWKVNFYNNSTYVKQILTTKNDTGIITFKINKDNTFNSITFGLDGASRDTTMRISLANLEDNKTYTLSFNVTNVTQGSISWQDIKIQEGTTATPYSPYNQGTVTIKQRGKNKFDYKQITPNASRTIENGGFVINNTDFQHGSSVGILKNLCPDLKVGDKFKFNWDTNATRNNTDVTYIYLSSYADTVRKDITYTCTQEMLDSETYFYGQQGEYYKDIIFYLDGQTSNYEPYQTPHDYTIQTQPLRSLPNGVKDTIEADGIHRRAGRIVLDGGSSETYGVAGEGDKTNGFSMYSTFAITNIKNSAYKSLLCNYFKFIDRNYVTSSTLNFITGGAGTSIVLNIDKTLLGEASVTGFKNWLSIHNIEVLYELAEEVIEPLTQNQATTMLDIIKTGSYEGTTNIYTDEDVKPTIVAGYYKKG